MKISSSFLEGKNKNCKKTSFKAIPNSPLYLPRIIGEIGKVAGEYINTPEQKLFLSTSALMLQPAVDLKYADEDKKTDVAVKSASKAIAGGLTGVTIRAVFLKIMRKFIGYNKHNKLNKYFFPDDAKQLLIEEGQALANVRMKQYQNTLGTLFAIIFMVFFSNSKVDVPLTSDIQDLILGIVKGNKSFSKSAFDVCKNRFNKIAKWFNSGKNKIVKIANKVKRIINVISSTNDNDNDNISKGDK